jgi:hypothetical protein
MSTHSQLLHQTIESLRNATTRVEDACGSLTDFQLNWRPDPKTWSVGLILEHLITTNRTYFPVFREIAEGKYKMKFWTRISPLSGSLGKSMVKTLGPDTSKTYLSPPAFRPTRSKVDAQVIARFREMQEELIGLIQRMDKVDLDKTKISSPASGFITYSLHHAIRIVDLHEARHLQQADRLIAHPDFPS